MQHECSRTLGFEVLLLEEKKKMDALKITILHISDPREAAAHISSPAPSDPASPPGGMLLYGSPLRQSNGAALIHIKEHTLNPFRSDDYDAGHLPLRGR